MKNQLKAIIFNLVIPIIIGFGIGKFIIWPYIIKPQAEKYAQETFDNIAQISLDSIYNQGYELGKVSMAIGIIKVLDSLEIKRPIPWNLRRASEIADSVKNSK